jgi:hypothetical protein
MTYSKGQDKSIEEGGEVGEMQHDLHSLSWKGFSQNSNYNTTTPGSPPSMTKTLGHEPA